MYFRNYLKWRQCQRDSDTDDSSSEDSEESSEDEEDEDDADSESSIDDEIGKRYDRKIKKVPIDRTLKFHKHK